MLTKAIEIDEKDENNSEFIMNLYYMATLCTDFVANGYDKYIPISLMKPILFILDFMAKGAITYFSV